MREITTSECTIEQAIDYYDAQLNRVSWSAACLNGFLGAQVALASLRQLSFIGFIIAVGVFFLSLLCHRVILNDVFVGVRSMPYYNDSNVGYRIICQLAWRCYGCFEAHAKVISNATWITAILITGASHVALLVCSPHPLWVLVAASALDFVLTLVISFIGLLLKVLIYYEEQSLLVDD